MGTSVVDRWLRRLFPHVSQGRIEKMCRKGELRVDGSRAKASTRLEVGQMVRVPPLPDADHKPADVKHRISDADARMIQSCVIYRDDHILALNKQHGLPVQGGVAGRRDMLTACPKHCGSAMTRTLGWSIDWTRTRQVFCCWPARGRPPRVLTAAFRHRDTRKIYWALVAGVPTPYLGEIKTGLVKAPGHGKHG